MGLMCRLRPFSNACVSSMSVERSHRLCVLPRYLSTHGRMGMGGTHCDMASTKQLSALGWQSRCAWWLPLHRNGPISPLNACQRERGSQVGGQRSEFNKPRVKQTLFRMEKKMYPNTTK